MRMCVCLCRGICDTLVLHRSLYVCMYVCTVCMYVCMLDRNTIVYIGTVCTMYRMYARMYMIVPSLSHITRCLRVVISLLTFLRGLQSQ